MVKYLLITNYPNLDEYLFFYFIARRPENIIGVRAERRGKSRSAKECVSNGDGENLSFSIPTEIKDGV